MQTTLRIDDNLFREAKAEAAREGISLTRLVENGIRQLLEKKKKAALAKPWKFRIYDDGKKETRSSEELKKLIDEEQEAHDLKKIGFNPITRKFDEPK